MVYRLGTYGIRVQSTNRKTPSDIASSRCMSFHLKVGLIDMAFLQIVVDTEIRLTFERWTCALDYVSVVLNDRFLLFLDGPPLRSLSSELLCAVPNTPNQE
ncbi:hypothetical protein AYI68_g6924 [Smittium mucronatum]|uniref:Uncharacterized protein n=1 Tax=Smittium mucronatum TaxID=133383 RepID=A0A1R0GQ89_9FUNG|nr:hypothetical protein AYI68_g6924 [Smittium mucronatum]